MLTYKQLKEFDIHATDGDIGGCKDVLFDDQDYVVRYLVADTNTWLPLSRKVVISPISVTQLDSAEAKVHVGMTCDELRDSPSIDEHKPVSREYEETLFQYYGYGYYWIGPGAWGDFAHPTELVNPAFAPVPDDNSDKSENHLRACSEVHGYDVATIEDDVGHITDFVIDAKDWSIKLFVLDTNNWLPGGRKLAFTPTDISKLDWSSHKVYVDLTHDDLMNKPEIDVQRMDDQAYIKSLINQAQK